MLEVLFKNIPPAEKLLHVPLGTPRYNEPRTDVSANIFNC